MSPWSPIELTRDCTATTVPRGEQVALTAGGLVEIVQRLGGSITVRTEMGSLLRLDGADADVLGLEVVNDVSAGTATGGFELTRVTDALQGIYGDTVWLDQEASGGATQQLGEPGLGDIDVTLVWDPPWTIQRMSEAARLQLGML